VVELKLQPSTIFRVQAQLDDFPIKLEFEGKAESLKGIVEHLNAIGALSAGVRQGTDLLTK